MNSETLGLLFMANHPTSIPLCEPEIQWPFRPHAHHNIIYSINYTTSSPNSPWTVTDCPNELLKFPHFGPKFWDRSNDRSRPQINSIINKTLKQSVIQDKTLTSRSLSKLLKTDAHVKPSLRRTAFLLGSTKSSGSISRNLREKLLSL